jgi:hypothetical protein
MAIKKKEEDNFINKTLNDYTDELRMKFIGVMEAGDSMKKCNPTLMQWLLRKDGVEMEEGEIKHLWRLIQVAHKAKSDKKNPYASLVSKDMCVAEFSKIFLDPRTDSKTKIDVGKELSKLNDWATSQEAEEVIKSNNEVMAMMEQYLSKAELEFLAFDITDEEVVIETSDDELMNSAMDKLEIV